MSSFRWRASSLTLLGSRYELLFRLDEGAQQANQGVPLHPWCRRVPANGAALCLGLGQRDARHGRGEACTIEEFGAVDVGVLVYDTEDPMKLHT